MLPTNIPWQVRQAHHLAMQRLMHELGFVDEHNRIRRFDGTRFHNALNNTQHTSMDISKCKCAQIQPSNNSHS